MRRLLRRGPLTIAALLTALPPVQAVGQAIPTATGPGASAAVGGGLSLLHSAYGQRDLGGGWVFADLRPDWHVGFEAEARFLHLHSSEDVAEKNYLIGPRVLVFPGRRRQLYAKFLIGDGHIDMPLRYAHGDFLALVPGADFDVVLNDYVDVRVADIEYQMWRDFPYGSLHPYCISAGFSLRLTRVVRFPKGSRARQ